MTADLTAAAERMDQALAGLVKKYGPVDVYADVRGRLRVRYINDRRPIGAGWQFVTRYRGEL